MDPNANLDEQREITERLLNESTGNPISDARRLAELVEGMDEWLSNGGFLPSAWKLQGK